MLLMVVIIGCRNDKNINGINPTQGEWQLVRKTQTPGYFHGLCFANQSSGWAVGDSGKILHTMDGGKSWYAQESRTTISLRCLNFFNSQTGWIGGASNSIGRTTDGGDTWTWQNPVGETRRIFMAVSFINSKIGWIVDNYSGILHTEDGGITWTPQTSGTSWGITSVQFLDNNEGWASATNRVVLHTTDGGNNWYTKTLDTLNYGSSITVTYSNIFFCSHSKGWISTVALSDSLINPLASVVCTSDTGRTWRVQRSPSIFMINSIKFVNENVGWAAGESGILHTTNGGENWTYEPGITDGIFIDMWFVDPSNGWALTFAGNIYKYQIL